MGNILYGLFLLAEFGLPAVAIIFVVVCIVRGEVSLASLKVPGLFLLWIVGGGVFSMILCSLMSADSEKAERVCFAIYCVISVLIYRLCKKEREGRD